MFGLDISGDVIFSLVALSALAFFLLVFPKLRARGKDDEVQVKELEVKVKQVSNYQAFEDVEVERKVERKQPQEDLKKKPSDSKKQAAKAKARTNADLISKESKYAYVKEIGYHGNFSESPNGEYLLVSNNVLSVQKANGQCKVDKTIYALVKDGQVIVHGKDMEKPDQGKVANNGTFIVNDWLSGTEREGIFYAINEAGKKIIAHKFSANIYQSWISDEGELAACMCAQNAGSPDGDTLTLFNLSTGNIIKQFIPEVGRAEDVHFDVASKVMHIKSRDDNTYRYTFDGHFIDQEKYRQDTIEDYSSFDFLADAEEMFKDLNNGVSGFQAKEVEQYVYKALKKKDFERYPNYKAKCYRILGEIKEGTGDVRGAVADYEKALSFDEKVGIKRRLAALKKEWWD